MDQPRLQLLTAAVVVEWITLWQIVDWVYCLRQERPPRLQRVGARGFQVDPFIAFSWCLKTFAFSGMRGDARMTSWPLPDIDKIYSLKILTSKLW